MCGPVDVISTTLIGAFLLRQRGARRMGATGGAIVNILSIDGYGPGNSQASYTAAQADLVGLTKAAAAGLATFDVRVNSVSPGSMHTKMVKQVVSAKALKHLLETFERVLMHGMVEIPKVAAAVAFPPAPRHSASKESFFPLIAPRSQAFSFTKPLPLKQ